MHPEGLYLTKQLVRLPSRLADLWRETMEKDILDNKLQVDGICVGAVEAPQTLTGVPADLHPMSNEAVECHTCSQGVFAIFDLM